MQRAAITLGRGKKRPQGELVEFDTYEDLDRILALHTGVEAWWSGGIFTENKRGNDRWLSQHVIGLDIDHHDHIGQHTPLTELARQQLEAALPNAPVSGCHITPRGARLVVLLTTPIVDPVAFPIAWASMRAKVMTWLPKIEVGSLRVDEACRDLARYFWAPRATVGGIVRDC